MLSSRWTTITVSSTEQLRVLKCGGREIHWELTRKSVKNVNLRVKSDGIVHISANTRVSVGFIENFIRENSDFIFKALDKFSKREESPQLPKSGTVYQSGDTVRYFGRNYTVSIEIGAREKAVMEDKTITVRARSADRTGAVLEKFYADETRRLFEALNRRTVLMFLAKGYKVEAAVLQIREMRSRWGSCHYTDGKIVMNSRLALYPEICAAYVFVHEYAHFIVPNHSKDFYAVVADIMPDYKICVNMLK